MDAIIDCTSQVFEGLITLADPARSWVAKWQRLDGYVRGVYAIKVSGQLPDEIVAAIEDEGRIRYIPYEPTSPIMTCGGALLTSRAGAMDLLRRQTDILVG